VPSGSAATSAAASDPVLSTVVSPAPASAAAKNAYVSGSSVEAHELVASSNLVVMASPASGATRRTPAVGGAATCAVTAASPASAAPAHVARSENAYVAPGTRAPARITSDCTVVAPSTTASPATLVAATSARPAPSTKLPAAVHS